MQTAGIVRAVFVKTSVKEGKSLQEEFKKEMEEIKEHYNEEDEDEANFCPHEVKAMNDRIQTKFNALKALKT